MKWNNTYKTTDKTGNKIVNILFNIWVGKRKNKKTIFVKQ